MAMSISDLQRLESVVTRFHRAIQQFDFSGSGLNLGDFPYESCHYASRLLGIFLFELGYENIVKMRGDRPDDSEPGACHLWLNVDGITVDITAYQFPGVQQEVIVEPFSEWHSNLNGRPIPFGDYGESLQDSVLRIKSRFNSRNNNLYDKICEKLSRP